MLEVIEMFLFLLIGFFMVAVLRSIGRFRKDLDHETKVRLTTCERIAFLERAHVQLLERIVELEKEKEE